MARRIHIPQVVTGEIPLAEREAHHVRDVLRLADGQAVEVFDDAGQVGIATLMVGASGVAVRVSAISESRQDGPRITIACAIPKANRADWLIEKLSELGMNAFIPLAAARSVVIPEGKNKLERWSRLAIEAAKQSHRSGVMKIHPVTPLKDAITQASAAGEGWCLSTSPAAKPILAQLRAAPPPGALTLFIGPEGDWSPDELAAFELAHFAEVSLGSTILRVETAALMGAAVMAAYRSDTQVRQSPPAP